MGNCIQSIKDKMEAKEEEYMRAKAAKLEQHVARVFELRTQMVAKTKEKMNKVNIKLTQKAVNVRALRKKISEEPDEDQKIADQRVVQGINTEKNVVNPRWERALEAHAKACELLEEVEDLQIRLQQFQIGRAIARELSYLPEEMTTAIKGKDQMDDNMDTIKEALESIEDDQCDVDIKKVVATSIEETTSMLSKPQAPAASSSAQKFKRSSEASYLVKKLGPTAVAPKRESKVLYENA